MIREINDANTILVTFFGFLLNFVTIWMISRHTQQEMLVYSQILLQTCIADILAICCNALVQPVGKTKTTLFEK
jgi:Co/Zn/Cd efflux system component